jgi:hypothetical protein
MSKSKLFLFDTNVYRRIVETIRETRFFGNKLIIHAMCDEERERGCQSIMSLTTSQELINHLQEDDESFEECNHALRLQFLHTQVLQKQKLLPTLDSLLAYFFYNEDSKEERLKFTGIVYQLIEKIFKHENISNLRDEIEDIRNDFLCYKKEFYMLFKSLLNQPDNNDNDWSVFKNDEKLKTFINAGNYIEFIVNYLIMRTKHFCKREEKSEINEERILEFEKYFKEALIHFKYLFKVLEDDGNALKEINKKQWNAVIDFHLVFEWCFLKYFNENKEVEVILVTQDKRRNFKDMHNRNTDVWDMAQYFEFIGFRVDKTNPQKLLLRLENNFEIEGIAQ